MKLVLIYNVWSDWDLLEYSVNVLRPLVDGVIIVGSETSNYGEVFPIPDKWQTHELFIREPQFKHPLHCETDKRNFGLQKAKDLGYTHFVSLDSDEVYGKEAFDIGRKMFIDDPDLHGIVCPCNVYVKSPSLSIGRDTTLIPFIHKLTPSIQHEFNRSYPNAWINGQIRIDPSRSLNINSGVKYTDDIVCQHYSWVRSDIHRKIRNSTAKANIERTNIAKNFFHLKEGDICELYPGKPLVRVPVKYGLPEFYGSSSEDL